MINQTHLSDQRVLEAGREGDQMRVQSLVLTQTRPSDVLSVVSFCPRCGAPIYGKALVIGEDELPIRYTCICRNGETTAFEDIIRGK